MKKYLLLASAINLFSFNAMAEDASSFSKYNPEEKAPELRLNVKRIALDFSNTSVKNSEQYQKSSVSALNSDSQSHIKGVADVALEYEQPTYQWTNSLYAAYGRTKVKALNKPETTNENEDQILVATDMAYKMWQYDGAFEQGMVGPFTNFGYQTEFTANDGAPKTQIVRNKTGIKFFNGKYFSNLYAAGVTEYDMTYSEKTTKFALEVGAQAKFPLREGVEFELDGYYRDYVYYSSYVGEDLKYDLNLVGRMNVKVIDDFALSPFVSYRYAQSRQAQDAGSNVMIGLSVAYGNIFKLD